MTLPLRKKLPTTVQTIRLQAKTLRRHARRGVFAAALVACSAVSLPAQTTASQYSRSEQPSAQGYEASQPAASQAPNWQPNRLPANAAMQPIAQAGSASSNGSAGGADGGVVLRWRESPRLSARAQMPVSHLSKAAAALDQPSAMGARAQVALSAAADTTSHSSNSAWVANPLRDSGAAQPATGQTHVAATAAATRPQGSRQAERGAVRAAAYQVPSGALDPFDDGGKAQQPAALPTTQLQPMPSDPLSQPELAPPPPARLPPSLAPLPQSAPPQLPPPQQSAPQFSPLQSNPSQSSAPQFGPAQPGVPQPGEAQPSTMPEVNDSDLMPAAPGQAPSAGGAQQPPAEGPSPFERARRPPGTGSPSDLQQETEEAVEQLERRRGADASVNCEYFRDRLRNATLDKINLKSGPRYGQGLGGDPEQAEKMRLDFAAGAEERDWCDRVGHTLVRGRMVDLYNEQVVLDVGGVRREIPIRDLCDVDLAYIGKAWNLPISCGSGHDVYAARGFVPSAVQWKASGLCHKPLYFEEVQLERYGHEVGPVLQPLISTAHFFGNIAVLPYKMGIHPPHECQYALGYYRPGDCAPYMLPPIPFSLRGAAAEAGVVVGAAALIP